MSDIDERFKELLDEYIEHRAEIKKMIVDLEELKKGIDRLIPQNLDARLMRFFEDRIKAITALFTTLLDMRKEIAKSVKDEIELRRKLGSGDDPSQEIEKYLDIRKYADKIDQFHKQKEDLKKAREEFDDNLDIEELKQEKQGE